MAESPAHKLGQIIGDELEAAVREPLSAIAGEFGLYLDHKHPRPARNGKRKVAWTDRFGNSHDLDYVIEAGGSESATGHPRAFIETAWRRYTKHSRNKAQEIQGAIAPLAETFRTTCPFLGVVLGGVFTRGAIDQFRSHGFNIAYCPYETVVHAFRMEGVDVSSEEHSSDAELQRKVDSFNRLSSAQRRRIGEKIRELHVEQFDPFFHDLRGCLGRVVQEVLVLALSGTSRSFARVMDAIRFVAGHDQRVPASDFVRYEFSVRYSNGDEIRARLDSGERAVGFLRSLTDEQ